MDTYCGRDSDIVTVEYFNGCEAVFKKVLAVNFSEENCYIEVPGTVYTIPVMNIKFLKEYTDS